MARSLVCPRWAPTQITQCTACARLTIIRANQPSCIIQARHSVAHELAPGLTVSGSFQLDGIEQILPGFYEGFSAFALQIGGKLVMVNADMRELGYYLPSISPVKGQELSQDPMVGKGV